METISENSENSAVAQKTKELCQAIIDQPDFQTIRRQLDAFLADESIKSQYQELSDRGAMLQHKQQTGMPLDMTEIADFEKRREAFLNNPVAQGFLAAQQAMHDVQESVSQHVAKTFELGRMPAQEDFDHGSCGHGCGCGH
ncbi:MAG TPA: YlbF family regulator [Haliangiales bacterium]|nr:YlbF family regulator [Haliangiales bacterium]